MCEGIQWSPQLKIESRREEKKEAAKQTDRHRRDKGQRIKHRHKIANFDIQSKDLKQGCVSIGNASF